MSQDDTDRPVFGSWCGVVPFSPVLVGASLIATSCHTEVAVLRKLRELNPFSYPPLRRAKK